MGWLSGWLYRKSHVINPASGAGTNYQIKIIVHYGSGTDSGPDVYLNGKCRADFGDVRFTASDGVTLLDYWMETYVAGDYAVFWVEVTDDLSSNPVTIYIYYGKSDAISISNGDATFLFFDDFDDGVIDPNKWSTYGSVSEGNGLLTVSAGYADSKVNILYAATRGRVKFSTTGSWWGFIYGAGNNPWTMFYYKTDGNLYASNYSAGGEAYVNLGTAYVGDFRVFEVRWVSGKSTFYVDDALVATLTNRVPSVNLRIEFAANNVIYGDWVLLRKYVDPEPAQDGWGSEESAGLTFSDTVSPTIEDTYSVSVPAPLSFEDTVSPTIEDTYSVSVPAPLSFEDTVSPTIEDSYSVSISVGLTFSDTISSTIEDSYSITILYPEIFRDTVIPTIEDSYSIVMLIPKSFRDTINVTIEDSYSVKTVIMPPPPGASIVIYGLWRLVERMLGMP